MTLVCQHLFENYLPVRQAYLYDLLGALDGTGMVNRVWSLKASNLALFSRPDIHVFFDERPLKKASVRLSSRLKAGESYLSEYLLRDSAADASEIVHAHFLWMSRTAQEIKRSRRVPTFLTAYGEDELFRASLNPRIARDVMNKLHGFDMIFAPSRYLLDLLESIGGKDARLQLLPIGIDLSKYKPASHVQKDRYTVLSVSRLIDRKGLQYLVQAIPEVLKSNPNVNFTIIGEGPERGALLSLASDLNVSGALQILSYQQSLGMRYAEADIFVLPSVLLPDGVTEGLGVPLLEAEASGLPIVSTTVGGIPDAVENGREGFLVRPGDPKSLAEKITCLIEDPALREKMGVLGRGRVRTEFDVRTQAERLAQHYDHALTKGVSK
jgi:colanic acid/amylovoran biosynthesis glycosyltransferase